MGRVIRRVESRLTQVVHEGQVTYGASATRADKVVGLLREVMSEPAVEEFWLLLLDGKHRVTGASMVSRGTLTTSLVHPREVFGPAVRMGAAAVIVCHNHPSGDPEPSPEDLQVTRRLVQGGRLLGIPVLDHLILGDPENFTPKRRYISLRERMSF